MLPQSGDVESNQLAVLQRVPCMGRHLTELETLLPLVHAIHLFDAEQPVGQVYMNFYSVAVMTKHNVGTKQVRVEWKQVFFRWWKRNQERGSGLRLIDAELHLGHEVQLRLVEDELLPIF